MFERVTKHPGSKKPTNPNYRAGEPGKKGNTWRALTRPLRRQPGWKKKMIKLAQERGVL